LGGTGTWKRCATISASRASDGTAESANAAMNREAPSISVIIPTRHRPTDLAACLEALCSQDIGRGEFEVIVVSDGPDDSLEALVSLFRDRINVNLVSKRKAGPAAARNAGAQLAKGVLLVFTDDDCLPMPGWLSALAARTATSPGSAIGGKTINALADNVYSTASQLLIDYIYRYYNANPAQSRFFASNNLALPAAGFRELGGFDEAFTSAAGEDRDLCNRWLAHGHGMVYAEEAVNYHAPKLSRGKYLRQQYNYGRGACLFRKRRSDEGGRRIGFEPLTFYARLVLYPLRRAQGPRALVLCCLQLLAQVAIAAGFFRQRFFGTGRPGGQAGRP
jgi:glycosyltransferase involved in cell wall biosynthesis